MRSLALAVALPSACGTSDARALAAKATRVERVRWIARRLGRTLVRRSLLRHGGQFSLVGNPRDD